MGWEDRDYSRGYRGNGGSLMNLLTGSVPLFRLFGIDVRAHATLVITLVLGLLFGLGPGFDWRDRLESSAALFLIVLLHEFGHCFAARRVGGTADLIVMHPLGGLAFAQPPHRPLPTFITVAGGPAVNVAICLVCGLILVVTTGWLPSNPFKFIPPTIYADQAWATLSVYSFWIYQMSWSLLIFNLMPIFPLDGGQMMQSALWPKMGYYRSMKLSTEIGMFAAVGGGAYALATGNLFLALLAVMGFSMCFQLRQQLLANGAEDYDGLSYAVGGGAVVRPKKKSWFVTRRERIQKQAIETEAADVDQILEKVARSGMNSLNARERKTLQRASENQRKRDAEKARRY